MAEKNPADLEMHETASDAERGATYGGVAGAAAGVIAGAALGPAGMAVGALVGSVVGATAVGLTVVAVEHAEDGMRGFDTTDDQFVGVPEGQPQNPLVDEMVRPYVDDDVQNQSLTAHDLPDEVDEFGNRTADHWEQTAEEGLTDEDVAETHDWRDVEVQNADEGWINEKVADNLAGERIDESTGRPLR